MAVESIEQIVSRIKRKKVKEWEVYFQKSVSHQIFLRQGKRELLQNTDTLGYSTKVHNGGIGFSNSNLITPDTIDKCINDALSLANVTKKIKFRFPPNKKTGKVKIVDKSLTKENARNSLSNYVSQLTNLVKGKNIKISFAKLKAFDINTKIVNSEGLEKEKEETYFYIELSLKSEREFWTNGFTRKLEQLPMEKINDWIVLAKKVSIAIEPKTDKVPVVFSPKVMVDAFVPIIGSHCNASSLKRKISYFMHHKQFSKEINVVDNGLYPFALMTSPFDDEGNPQEETIIIEKGSFKNYLYDQLYAKILNKKPTGNGIRQRSSFPLIDNKYTSQPGDQPSNLMILPGKKKLDKLISEIDKGLIVYQFSWLTPNEDTGNFASEIRNAAYIENGEITKPVKGGMVSGNVFDLLKNVSGISKEFEIVSGATAFSGIMPYGRFENLQIAGRN